MRMLLDEEWSQWSDREIARRCNVGHPLVAEIRAELFPDVTGSSSSERTYINKHGSASKMHTSRIGRSDQPRDASEAAMSAIGLALAIGTLGASLEGGQRQETRAEGDATPTLQPQPKHIGPIDLCAMDVRARALKAMDAMLPDEWPELFVVLQNELRNLEKVAEHRRNELRSST